MDSAGQRVDPSQRSRYDVRPRLLALCCRQELACVQPCIDYGLNYLHAWCKRCGFPQAPDVLGAAVLDGLLRVYWGRDRRGVARPTLAQRARSLHVDAAHYLLLKHVAEHAFRWRLREALAGKLFAPADPHTGLGITNRLPVVPIPRCRGAQSPALIQDER